jgi:hypothetical protein
MDTYQPSLFDEAVIGHFKTGHLGGWVFDRVGKVEFKGKT